MAYTTIDDPSAYFQTLLHNSSSNTAASYTFDGNSEMQPDLVWHKNRDYVDNHYWFDSSRGAEKAIYSNSSGVEVVHNNSLTSFDSNGYSVGSSNVTSGAGTYASWCWKANGGTTSSNTDGTITSTVQANTTAGFSIVTWTGSGSAGTIGHGLGAVPTHFIVKERNGADDWANYSPFLDGLNYVFSLNNTYSQFTPASYINSTAPTSSVFSVDGSIINQSGQTYVGYFFTDIQGYSKMGKYKGNGNTNGTFVYTGFKPAFILIKNLDATENWFLMDNKRDGYNLTNKYILAGNTAAESTTGGYGNIDLLSNGFKLRSSYQSVNSTHEFAYLAFAENPFVTSTGIPTTAR